MAEPPQKYAEYQDSAPELITPSQAIGSGNPESGPEFKPGHPDVSVEGTPNKRKVLGLAPRTAAALILISLIVIVGVVVGAVLGTQHKNHHGKLPAARLAEHFWS
jgi:hypothetical protein